MALNMVLTRRPRSDDELDMVVKTLFGYVIPRHKVCPDHDAPFDAFSQAYFGRDQPQTLIWGSRGLSGKSRLVSVLGLTFAVVDGAEVSVLGGSLAQSRNVHDTIRDVMAYPGFNQGWLNGPPSNQLIRFQNGALIRPLTASQKTVRGYHPPKLLLDELDEMDPEIMESAKGQPMPQKNHLGEILNAATAMSSTWQKSDGPMRQEMDRFRDEQMKIHAWCMYDTSNPVDGWLDPDFIEQKRREVSAERFRVEYLLNEPSIGNRAFASDAVEEMFIQPDGSGLWQYTDPGDYVVKNQKEYQEYHFEDYRTDREYTISADWAKEQDWTVISVIDVTYEPARVVHWVRFHHLAWPIMIRKFNVLMQQYNADAIHDKTGIGNVINDMIDTRAMGFLMTGEKRDNMLYAYIAAVEQRKIIAPRIGEFYRAHLYASTEDMFARGKEFHLPDEICSMGLGWHLINRRAPADINFEAFARDRTGESAFERAISSNKQPVRAQDVDRQKGSSTIPISHTGVVGHPITGAAGPAEESFDFAV